MNESVEPAARLLGDRIRKARVNLGLSQEAIAALAAMHVTNFGKIERGHANPSLLTIVRIAAVLGTDVASLTQDITREHTPQGIVVHTAHDFLMERQRRSRRSR